MRKYKQVYLGGPMHGQRRFFGEHNEHDYIEFRTVLRRPTYSLRDLEHEIALFEQLEYIGMDCAIFGAHLRFYILREEMDRKDDLVRDFLLFGMEV